jgi:hypothetical protein
MQILSCQCPPPPPKFLHISFRLLLARSYTTCRDLQKCRGCRPDYSKPCLPSKFSFSFFFLSGRLIFGPALSQRDLQCQLISRFSSPYQNMIDQSCTKKKKRGGGGKAHWQMDGIVVLGAIEFTGIWSSVFVAVRALPLPVCLPRTVGAVAPRPTCMGLACFSGLGLWE